MQEISRQLRLDGPEHALEALMSWSRQRLLQHLRTFTAEQLRPPSMLRRL